VHCVSYFCNLHKDPNLSGIDPESSEITRLFHPRSDEWHDHFDTLDGFVHGLTDIGRVTVVVLHMNTPRRIEIRVAIEKIEVTRKP
jgi:hypothetical protein